MRLTSPKAHSAGSARAISRKSREVLSATTRSANGSQAKIDIHISRGITSSALPARRFQLLRSRATAVWAAERSCSVCCSKVSAELKHSFELIGPLCDPGVVSAHKLALAKLFFSRDWNSGKRASTKSSSSSRHFSVIALSRQPRMKGCKRRTSVSGKPLGKQEHKRPPQITTPLHRATHATIIFDSRKGSA